MNSEQTDHPTKDRLIAYAVGNLASDEIAAIEKHLGDCAAEAGKCHRKDDGKESR